MKEPSGRRYSGTGVDFSVTSAIIGYLARLRPSLVFSGALAEKGRALIGDAQGGH